MAKVRGTGPRARYSGGYTQMANNALWQRKQSAMKTYQDNGYRYYYDTHIRMWTIYVIDQLNNQVGNADYHANKSRLIVNYPMLQFKTLEVRASKQDKHIKQTV